jgi:hypothetical protein
LPDNEGETRLRSAKNLLSEHLITETDYERVKADVLSIPILPPLSKIGVTTPAPSRFAAQIILDAKNDSLSKTEARGNLTETLAISKTKNNRDYEISAPHRRCETAANIGGAFVHGVEECYSKCEAKRGCRFFALNDDGKGACMLYTDCDAPAPFSKYSTFSMLHRVNAVRTESVASAYGHDVHERVKKKHENT